MKKYYCWYIITALDILAPNGTMLLCTNNSTFSLKAFKKVVKETLENAGVAYELQDVMGLPKVHNNIVPFGAKISNAPRINLS